MWQIQIAARDVMSTDTWCQVNENESRPFKNKYKALIATIWNEAAKVGAASGLLSLKKHTNQEWRMKIFSF